MLASKLCGCPSSRTSSNKKFRKEKCCSTVSARKKKHAVVAFCSAFRQLQSLLWLCSFQCLLAQSGHPMCTVCFAEISLQLEGFRQFACFADADAFRDFVVLQTVGWQPTLQAAFSCKKPPIAACSFCCTSLYRTAGCVTAVLNRRNATAGIFYIAASSFFSRTCQALLAASFASWDILGAAFALEVSGLLTYFRGPLLYGLPCWDMPKPTASSLFRGYAKFLTASRSFWDVPNACSQGFVSAEP